MDKLEPTYLRHIFDGLSSKAIHPDNAAALPDGLIGLYEQAFTEKTRSSNRQEVLTQLSIFALMKGAVGIDLIASILKKEKAIIADVITRFSNWFNSPKSGTFTLYHDRLKVFLLQKLNQEQIIALNEKIIAFLEHTSQAKNDTEAENYALKHLANHMRLASELGHGYERLHTYVNQENLWRRQIQVSKGYDWSQHALQQGIKESARKHHEINIIRSTVNSVKLKRQEQNSAEDILKLLNQGDYKTALKRAERWEGDRQFKLYLLFIHELTIGQSKTADFRLEACKAVLDAIDQTPEDSSIIDWATFFPETAIYTYNKALLDINLDGLNIWRRGNYSLEELVNKPMVDEKLLFDIAKDLNRTKTFLNLCLAQIKRGSTKLAIETAKLVVENEANKKFLNKEIKETLPLIKRVIAKDEDKQQIIKTFENLPQKSALRLIRGPKNKFHSVEDLLKENKTTEAIDFTETIDDKNLKEKSYQLICKNLIQTGEASLSINLAQKITAPDIKFQTYIEITTALIEQNDLNQARTVINQGVDIIEKWTNIDPKNKTNHLFQLIQLALEINDKSLAKSILEQGIKAKKDIADQKTKLEYQLKTHQCLTKINEIERADLMLNQTIKDFDSISNSWYGNYYFDQLLNTKKEYLLVDKVLKSLQLSDKYTVKIKSKEHLQNANTNDIPEWFKTLTDFDLHIQINSKKDNILHEEVKPYLLIARGFIRLDKLDNAKNAIDTAFSVHGNIEDESENVFSSHSVHM